MKPIYERLLGLMESVWLDLMWDMRGALMSLQSLWKVGVKYEKCVQHIKVKGLSEHCRKNRGFWILGKLCSDWHLCCLLGGRVGCLSWSRSCCPHAEVSLGRSFVDNNYRTPPLFVHAIWFRKRQKKSWLLGIINISSSLNGYFADLLSICCYLVSLDI